MTLYSYFHKRPILVSNVKLEDLLVKKLNNSHFSNSKYDIGFWDYFPNYKFELADDLIYFSLDRENSKNMRYLNVLFADFRVYKDKNNRLKLKISSHDNLFTFYFVVLFLALHVQQFCFLICNFKSIDLQTLLFFVLGVFSVIEFFFYNINSVRLEKLKYFINSKSYEMDNPNEDA
jgi:hypothetical protein